MKTLRNICFSLVILLGAIAPSCPRAAFAQTTVTTVIGGLGPGLGQSVNPFSAATVRQQTIATLTAQAATANANAKSAYLQMSQDWLTNAVHARDLGQAIPPVPAPPQVQHVDQTTGVQSSGPDLVATPPVLPAPIGVPSNGSIASSSPASDRLDQLLNGMSALWDLIQQMQAELVSIKSKVGAQ